MQRIKYNHRKSDVFFRLIFFTIVLVLQLMFISIIRIQAENDEIEQSVTSDFALENEPNRDELIEDEAIGEQPENDESEPDAPTALQEEINIHEAIMLELEEDEVEVGTPDALQDALNSDVSIIKIIPQNGQDFIALDKPLTISKSRTVTLAADNPVRIIGASGQWQLITSPDNDVSIKFNNVALDGNNASGGIYNRGTLTLENAVIQNCYHINGGVGIYSISNLTVNNSLFINNFANPIYYSDGGGIYARGLTSRITVNISKTVFQNNSARYGGGVRIDNADINIIDCEFSDNTAAQGPCIYVAACQDTNISNCRLTENTGSGAIFVNNSSATITSSTISNNNGRGIYGYAEGGDASITVKGSTEVSGNSAKTSYGGGIVGYSWGASKATINIEDNAIISNNEAENGGGVSGYPGSYVIINITDNAQIINNTAYKNGGGIYGDGAVNISGGKINSNTAMNGGGIYGAPETKINISDAIISDNTAEQDGGGIWVADLDELTVNNSAFQNNSALTGYFWRTNDPSDDKQFTDAATHNERIINTSYTAPYTNAYSNHDINYTAAAILTPYTVTYNANNTDGGIVPTDQNNPYIAGEEVTILAQTDTLVKSGFHFAGWNTEPNGMGNHFEYDEGNVQFIPPSFIMDATNVVLYAQWKETATAAPEQPTVTPEEPTSIPGEPTSTPVAHGGGGTGYKPKPTTTPEPLAEIITPTEGSATIPEAFGEIEYIPEVYSETVILDFISDYPPDYQLVQSDDDVIELDGANDTLIGQWVNNGVDWTYHANPDNPQLIPEEDGSFEVVDQYDQPIGLWSKNDDDEWVYEEYAPMMGRWGALFASLLALAGLLFYFFIIARRYVTRKEFVRMVVNTICPETEIENTTPYTDVSEDSKYYLDIMNAKAAGLLSGFKDSDFQPDIYITREEIASITGETVRYTNIPITVRNLNLSAVFKDFASINELFLSDIQLIIQLEIMRGRSDDSFGPEDLFTRKQAKKIIRKLKAAIPYDSN